MGNLCRRVCVSGPFKSFRFLTNNFFLAELAEEGSCFKKIVSPLLDNVVEIDCIASMIQELNEVKDENDPSSESYICTTSTIINEQ